MIIYQGIKAKASDIHVEPFEKRDRPLPRGRHDARGDVPPKKLQAAIASRLKIMASLDIAEKKRPQDGKFQVKVEGRTIDFRVSVLPTLHGEKVVLRILDSSNLGRSLDTLGFEPRALADFKAAIDAPYGMILVTGPTGSGKTTTLYSAVKEMLTPEMNFVTVEDPVEYQLEGVNQVQVNPKRGMTFAGALRSILRQDPDIVMVGEIRDTETIEIAVKAALTGHLVLSTLHTNDAASTITRMCDMGVDPFMVSSSTLLVSAQRLMRRLCEHCREPIPAPPDRLIAVGYTRGGGRVGAHDLPRRRVPAVQRRVHGPVRHPRDAADPRRHQAADRRGEGRARHQAEGRRRTAWSPCGGCALLNAHARQDRRSRRRCASPSTTAARWPTSRRSSRPPRAPPSPSTAAPPPPRPI